MPDPTDIDRLAEFLTTQINSFIKMGDYEEFPVSEILAALLIVQLDVYAGAGFHRWRAGVDARTARKLRGEPDDVDVDEVEIEDDEDDEDTEEL